MSQSSVLVIINSETSLHCWKLLKIPSCIATQGVGKFQLSIVVQRRPLQRIKLSLTFLTLVTCGAMSKNVFLSSSHHIRKNLRYMFLSFLYKSLKYFWRHIAPWVIIVPLHSTHVAQLSLTIESLIYAVCVHMYVYCISREAFA